MKKQPLIIITGPTASGKSELAIELAKTISGEIISADSMQVYQGMNIGTAKITKEQMQGVPHHLIDILEPTQEFNVCLFQSLAKKCVKEILERGHIPIVAGGTGFYIQALLYDIDFEETKEDTGIRSALEKEAKILGPQVLHERLKQVDKEAAYQIHPNNIKRVIRALEYFEQTGKPISSHNKEERQKESPYTFCYFVLERDRKELYDRIDKRVDKMMEEGLLLEVRQLRKQGVTKDMTSMQGLGYKELFPVLFKETSLEDAICTIKKETRHFAKRQMTWFRRERDVIFLSIANKTKKELLLEMISYLKEKQICD